MPEMPELQAHAERLDRRLRRATTAAVHTVGVHGVEDGRAASRRHIRQPARDRRPPWQVPAAHVRAGDVHRPPDAGWATARRREAVGQAARRPGPLHVRPGGRRPALLLTEQGTERRAGVWCVPTVGVLTSSPLDKLGPEAATIEPDELAARFAARRRRASTGSCATSAPSPASAGASPTRCATAPSCRRSR